MSERDLSLDCHVLAQDVIRIDGWECQECRNQEGYIYGEVERSISYGLL